MLVDALKSNSLIIHLKGLLGSSSSLLAASVFSNLKKNMLIVLPDKEEAAYFHNDLLQLVDKNQLLFFPSAYKRAAHFSMPDSVGMLLRTETLNKLSYSSNYYIVVSYPEALSEKVVTKNELTANTLKLKVGERVSIEFINDVLNEYHFDRTDFVYEPGQFAVRGGIVDIFSYSHELPYRIDFFGEEVDSIRTFDIENQLSIEQLSEINIIANINVNSANEKKISFLDYISNETILWINETELCINRIENIYKNAIQQEELDPEEDVENILCLGSAFLSGLKKFKLIEFGNRCFFESKKTIEFKTSLQPAFNKNFNLICGNLLENKHKGYQNIILSDNEKQIERLTSIFEDINKDVTFTPIPLVLHEGFIDHDEQLCIYTDHQIFERYHKFKIGSSFAKKDSITLKDLTELHPGDYVVHIDHGIGKFGGLDKVEVNGKIQEAIRLIYKDNDILYVNIHSLHRISKYKGKDDGEPKINKLGSGAWAKLKLTAKKKVKDIAKELIALYAKRRAEKGFEFSPDTYLQRELEASFIYEDTPDQEKATKAVKENMESSLPMDRLICGDVGFGKTEIAIRAAFKAVADNKQVAILVPTTILALQHYKTIGDRLKNFPCTVDHLSRLRKPSDQKEVIKKLQEGKIDIIIGTHKLIGSEIKFKDLGLLIIDEEQKFGVAMKEKLKKLKVNIDTLTLTATPIPRTLQFSLMGARDLSIINTPPSNRHPIVTELHTFNDQVIREAINYEVSRGGQAFFIHNRVQNILEVEALVRRICPDVKTLVAHGQMDGEKLENIMLDFMNGDFDVLIATTIIENGLDISNANTIIINDAQNFGLSDLHQLRGRVGRSNRKAFCYLLAPPLNMVTQEARRRLKAIEDFSGLGSGFNIALQDLDIRGAGNMLGGEQSGFIADIGFETYHKILNEAMNELKQEEFKDLFTNDDQKLNDQYLNYTNDCQIETDLQLLLSDKYINSTSERISLYRELDNIQTEEKLKEFEHQLVDRFGKLPTESMELLNIVRLRWKAIDLGFEKIILKNKKFIGYFIANQDSPFYRSATFSKILGFLQHNPHKCSMKEKNNKLTLSFENISDLSEAIQKLNEIINAC